MDTVEGKLKASKGGCLSALAQGSSDVAHGMCLPGGCRAVPLHPFTARHLCWRALVGPAWNFIPLFLFLGIVPPVHYTHVLSVPPLEFLPGNIQLYTQELC